MIWKLVVPISSIQFKKKLLDFGTELVHIVHSDKFNSTTNSGTFEYVTTKDAFIFVVNSEILVVPGHQ